MMVPSCCKPRGTVIAVSSRTARRTGCVGLQGRHPRPAAPFRIGNCDPKACVVRHDTLQLLQGPLGACGPERSLKVSLPRVCDPANNFTKRSDLPIRLSLVPLTRTVGGADLSL